MCSLADRGLKAELDTMRKKFRTTVMSRDAFIERRDGNPKSIVKAEKAVVADEQTVFLKRNYTI